MGKGVNQIKALGENPSFRGLHHQNRTQCLLFDQEQPPYNLKAFRLRIDFPRDYPLKPPTLKFITKIYHPNVREDGLVCLPLISIANWKPHTKTYQGRAGLAQKRVRVDGGHCVGMFGA